MQKLMRINKVHTTFCHSAILNLPGKEIACKGPIIFDVI